MKKLLLLAAAIGLLASCQPEYKSFALSEVNFFSNLSAQKNSLIKLPVDLDDAILKGIEIPAKSQTSNGYFNFTFKVKNTSDKLQRLYYKIFYQNETYRVSEADPFAYENFYGSWEDTEQTFKPVKTLGPGEEIVITDSFRIVGNPRNEKIYYGPDPSRVVNQETIRKAVAYIKSIPDWVKQIQEKAVTNKVSEEEQFYIDALWSLNDEKQRDTSHNNRWKRNPRMGKYEFMLVVAGQEDLDKYPEAFKDISVKHSTGEYLNPFAFVREYGLNGLRHSVMVQSEKKVLVNARFDLAKGIYINPLSVSKPNFTRDYFNTTCSDSGDKYAHAPLELFFHNINRDYVLHNVKEVRNVTEDMTRAEYKNYASNYKNAAQLIDTYVQTTDCPCRNVSVDTIEHSVTLRNPGNKEGEYRKEHVGVISRVGFTYGTFRAKIKFPKLLSRDHVWNGITNAFWLMAQDVNLGWNMRRICDADVAYIPKQEADDKASMAKSKKQITYSEIDFEILKESEFWPKTSYQISNVNYQTDDCANNDDIMVTCTNWDMACHQPEYFNIGAMAHKIGGVKYIHHRWNEWYKALTTKVRSTQKELFESPYYYYEVNWTPDKITWRIGPEKDRMRVICVMDKNVTAIPNNQMLMIITQEWHNQEWWPTAPYKQNFIPFPKNDIVGKVLELEVE
jgi:hypothetical protein